VPADVQVGRRVHIRAGGRPVPGVASGRDVRPAPTQQRQRPSAQRSSSQSPGRRCRPRCRGSTPAARDPGRRRP
jgi:hypothetical protein